MLRTIWISILAMSVLLPGCQDYGFEELPRSVIREKRWSQTVAVSSAADILFVVDGSGSMVGEQVQLGESFASFVSVLNEKFGEEFHIAIITTGMESQACPPCDGAITKSCVNETGENGRFQDRLGHITWTAGEPIFDFVTDSQCRVVTNSNTSCFYDVAQQRGIALVGVNGCGYERGLAPLKSALGPTLLGAHNAGFLRDDATLAVIIISDEDDCGEPGDVYEMTTDGGNVCYFAAKGVGPDPSNPVYTPMTYHPDAPDKPYQLTPVEEYYDFLVNDVKGGRKGMVKFAAIVGMNDVSDPSTTTIDYWYNTATTRPRWEITDACTTPGCSGDYCFAEPGTRYIKLAQLFGVGQNAFLDTICQSDFSATMQALGTFVACPRQFKLSDPPLDPSLASILINGEQVPLYSCSIQGRLETCSGPSDASCSQGSCVRTWVYCANAGSGPECAGLDYSNAAGGVITFADHYDPCELITEGEINIEFVYVPQG